MLQFFAELWVFALLFGVLVFAPVAGIVAVVFWLVN